ncbi:unnamed protein product, partial [Prorocentrum cordatum]
VKLILSRVWHVPPGIVCLVLLSLLAASTVASVIQDGQAQRHQVQGPDVAAELPLSSQGQAAAVLTADAVPCAHDGPARSRIGDDRWIKRAGRVSKPTFSTVREESPPFDHRVRPTSRVRRDGLDRWRFLPSLAVPPSAAACGRAELLIGRPARGRSEPESKSEPTRPCVDCASRLPRRVGAL